MKIIRGLEQLHSAQGCAVTMGTFDGVHRGHARIVETLIAAARERQLKTVLITFDPHPRQVLLGPENVQLLTTLDEKLELLKQFELDCVAVVNFDQKLAELPYQQFLEDVLLKQLNMRVLVVGYDHGFGKGRQGTYENLKAFSQKDGFELYRVDPLTEGTYIIKSSTIRRLLAQGEVQKAAELLGHRYLLKGEVVKGRLLGKKLGFPTANLKVLGQGKLIPKDGVYAVDVALAGKTYKGMLNIGFRPTVNHTVSRSVEVHIHEFSGNIYGEQLTVYFKKRLRDEQKFDSLEKLKEQLTIDKQQSLKI